MDVIGWVILGIALSPFVTIAAVLLFFAVLDVFTMIKQKYCNHYWLEESKLTGWFPYFSSVKIMRCQRCGLEE